MRFLTGDECGLLKEYVPEIAHKKIAKEAEAGGDGTTKKPDIILPVHYDVAKINNSHGIQRVDPTEIQTRARGVVAMAFCDNSNSIPADDHDQFSYASLRANGSVEIWQAKTSPAEQKKKKFANHQRLSLSGDIFETSRAESGIPNVPVKPLALANLGTNSNNSGRLCASDTHGNIVILKTDPSDSYKPVSVVQQFAAFQNTEDNITLTYTKGKVMNTQLASAMAVDSSAYRVAIGGRERDVRLIDLELGTPIWKAKNLPPDPQTLLQQPVWPSAMTFVNNNTNNPTMDSNLLAVGTAFGQLRLYDVRTKPEESITRRPIRFTPDNFMEHRITAICQVSDQQVVVGDTTGDIHALDLRNNLNGQYGNKQIDGSDSLGRYVGPAGSIRQLVKHERLPIMAAVGCDRMLRTYNTQTQKAIDCVYLKQRLNCVLAFSEGHTDDFAEIDGDDDGANGGNMDMDQEDVVKDYVDSSDDESDSDNDNNLDSQPIAEDDEENDDNGDETPSSKDEVDLNNNQGAESESESVSESDSKEADKQSSSDGSESDSEEDSVEDQGPRKRRKR